MNRFEWTKGCVLGGAVGDALGAPVENSLHHDERAWLKRQ